MLLYFEQRVSSPEQAEHGLRSLNRAGAAEQSQRNP